MEDQQDVSLDDANVTEKNGSSNNHSMFTNETEKFEIVSSTPRETAAEEVKEASLENLVMNGIDKN